MNIGEWRERFEGRLDNLREQWGTEHQGSYLGVGILLLIALLSGLGWYWSQEPDMFDVDAQEGQRAGFVLAQTATTVASTLLDKPGGYIRNDMLPPGVFMDNMPAWELGVVQQLRSISRALYRDMSLSHALYIEDKDLALAEPQFNVDAESWVLPSTESEYRRGQEALAAYAKRLASEDAKDAQFYPRGEYLQLWLADVDVNLGRLSSRLNGALPGYSLRLNSDVSGDALELSQTDWADIDDVFYEARGSSWALLHLLKAIEVDFAEVLTQRNAVLSLRAAIHELEATQQTVWSPVILNGSGFGVFANHSLVMANYISRAQTDLRDVQNLLRE